MPLLKNPAAKWKRPAYTFIRCGKVLGGSIRTEAHRYTEWDHGQRGAELYDHQADPREERDLAGDPRHAPMVKRLKALLEQAPNYRVAG